ncbi:alpha-amylase family glycosyl hydrolase [Catalinimonas niigatensis]|uniref:alpha-amylase family glycosyl hydrolase n=1 Tax=Catalinimonas niigatensis TaxID=1397264 RepID=UPI002666E3A8|nr:alpha-amylase family glycosyl hydrolase [Catalinimonas niigatensis]WPP51094.1 alpha-amylase family glycosyl hydrolase [Catalinimonas niigatensis]
MPTPIESQLPQTLAEASLDPRGNVFPSPVDWRDQFLYFLLPDRFSDGNENSRPAFDRNHPNQHTIQDRSAWQISGKDFQGGSINGIRSKLDYLKNLGITALWIGPIFRQRPDLDTYHGYGIQNFLDVDPRFGTRQDLRDLVDAAHERDMYVLLDVIYNHSGNNWFYNHNGQASTTIPYRYQPPHAFHSWRSATGQSTESIHHEEDGVWPEEFQNLGWYTRAGEIGKWDPESWEDPLHPDNEFRRGDFFDLKDLRLSQNEVLAALIKVYQYWISLSDCDGFRIDTVKHVSFEASRNFCGAIHEYCESIGKSNFLLLGEVTGGEGMARNYLEIFGRNIDAVLDIGAPASRIAGMVKGSSPATHYFDQFQGHDILGTHRETGRYHVSILDDHDMVGRSKHRFAAHNTIAERYAQTAHAVGTQLTTLGIPCLYYGTEQAFDGSEDLHDAGVDSGFEDRYIRETMFGATFGAFWTSGCHFFDPEHPSYQRISAISKVRNRQDMIGLSLRRGRQYLRETSFLNQAFSVPGIGELNAWSRLLFNQEVLVALNTHGTENRGAAVTIDTNLHPEGSRMRYLYRSDWSEAELVQAPQDQFAEVLHQSGRASIRLDLPPAGMCILA